jgi:uncharacterized membrane protein YqjE
MTALDAIREQYRKTLIATQITIGVVTLVVLLQSHRLPAAVAFFFTMQVGAVIGALWAVRLKRRIELARSMNPRA